MPRFKVEFVEAGGQVRTGEFDGPNERGVLSLLETRGLTAIAIAPAGPNAAAAARATSSVAQPRRGKSVRRALLDFTHQMTAVLESGLPVISGLRTIADQTEHLGLKASLRRVAGRVEGGSTLADALLAEPEFFAPVYVKTVAAGESAGTLPDVFQALARYMEDAEETRGQVKSALMYPALVIGTLVIAVVVMLIFVVPRFQDMFAKFGTELPLPTRIVLGMSTLIRNHWIEIVAGLAIGAWGFRQASRHRTIAAWLDERTLRLPVFGKLLVGAYMHRMVELLNLLTRSSLPITHILRVTGDSMENEAVRGDLRQMLRSVEGGKTLGEAFGETRWLTPLVKRMLAVGEQTGRTDQIFEYLARYYATVTKRSVKTISTLIEPVLIASLAVVVLIFALAIFLPMFKMLRMVSST